jgi:hypothetical protein
MTAWALPPTVDTISRVHLWNVSRYLTGGPISDSANLSGNQTIQLYFGIDDDVINGAYLTIVKSVANKPNRWFDIGGTGAPPWNSYMLLTGSVTSTSSPSLFSSFSDFTLANRNGGGNPLPIQLTSFDAQLNGQGGVICNWTAASQVNNKLFTVEKSSDGYTFDTVATLPGAGTTSKTITYSALDENPFSGTSYYRLQQTDFDGKYTFSNIVPINIEAESGLTIFPNPVSTDLIVKYSSTIAGPMQVKVIDMAGRVISTSSFNLQLGNNSFFINVSNIAAGTYFLEVNDGIKVTTSKFIRD